MPGYNSQVAQMSDGGAATAGGMIVDGHNSSEYEGNTSYAPRAPLNLPKTPRKLGRKPPVKGHKRETLYDIARRVPVSIMREYFNFSLRQAADAMSISVTSLKRLCRRHGVKRWPHRQLSGLNRAVTHLEEKQQTSSDPTIAEQLHQLYSRRDVIIDQAFTSDDTGSEPRRDSPSRSENEEGDVLLEQDEALTPPRVAENPSTTIPRLQREPGTTWTHEQQHQQKQPQQQQQQQHPSSDHDREFEAVEGAKARGREDYPTRGWGRSSMSPDRRRNSSKPVSMGGGHSGFRASNPPPSSAVAFAPEETPEQSQARRSPQNPLSRAGSAVDATTDVSSGAFNIGNGTHPSRPREKVSSLPTHVASLPQQRSSGNAEAPITKIAVLNALLLGGGPSEGPASPGSLSRARATAGGTHPRRRRCSEGPKEGGGGGRGGAWGRTQDDMSGPLPSIARLVEAGALLSGAGESDWR